MARLSYTSPSSQATAGTSLAKVNGHAIVTGAHKYTYDLKRQGMLYSKVLYPPQFGATLISLDASAAEAMPGVQVVHEGNFVRLIVLRGTEITSIPLKDAIAKTRTIGDDLITLADGLQPEV